LASGAGISNTASGSILSGGTIPTTYTTNLTADFAGITFQSGATYAFTLISSYGNRFPTTATAYTTGGT
jgi:hypothetical protein